MSEPDTSPSPASNLRRTLRFAGGFVVGLVSLPVALVVLFVILLALPEREDRAAPFLLTTAGTDISQAGGTVVQVQRSTNQLSQRCREACDDLRLEGGRGALEAVRVLDAQGGCLRCDDLSKPYAAPTSGPWRVAGAPRLAVERGRRE